MINYDNVTIENINKYNSNWQFTNHTSIILLIGGSGSKKKTNALPNLIKQQDDGDYSIIDKIYFYVKDPPGGNHQ